MEIDQQIRAARLKAVYERLPVALAFFLVNALAVAAVMSAGGAPPWVWGWFAAVAAVVAVRGATWAAFRHDRTLRHPGRWEAAMAAGALATGLAWGAGAALLVPGEAIGSGWIAPLVMLLLLGTMAAVAATLHAVHVPSSLCFILSSGLPLAAGLAWQGDGHSLLMAAMVVLYVAVLTVVTRRSGRQYVQSFRLGIELDRRTAALDEANAALRAEIEDHRATGETLRQAQRMEAIGQLTGGIAHDFNNVLAVIGGSLQLIAKRAEGNPDIARLVLSAERATERGARLTASLLSFAREQRLRPVEVDLNEMVRECAPMLRRMLGGRMELALALSPGRLVARTDPAQFQAALMHLAINARDAVPPGPRLTIATSLVPTAEAAPGPDGGVHPGPFACVRVSDTGPGMAPEVAARAFEPFFTTREVGQGSGLGLSQVYGFARQSGGCAAIERPQGGGVAVCLMLPALPAQALEPAAPAEEPGFAGRVLLVEDDADVREVLKESLAASGWEVTQAADGTAATQVLEGGAPLDIVVSDVVMPGTISGVQLARAVRRLRPELPVLLISGFPGAALADHGAEEGELNLMRKPFTHAELLGRMRDARQAAGRRVSPAAARGTAASRAAGE